MTATAVVSNASGLPTLAGDPATFFIGRAIHLSFTGYLARASIGGLLTILATSFARDSGGQSRTCAEQRLMTGNGTIPFPSPTFRRAVQESLTDVAQQARCVHG